MFSFLLFLSVQDFLDKSKKEFEEKWNENLKVSGDRSGHPLQVSLSLVFNTVLLPRVLGRYLSSLSYRYNVRVSYVSKMQTVQ